MSRALAGARQRRAGVMAPEPQVVAPQPTQANNQNGLTLPQVIALVDTRLTKLEKFMKETQETGIPVQPQVRFDIPVEQRPQGEGDNLSNVLQEMKDTLMKLQTYTMDVNKLLLEERVNVLSDLGSSMTVKEDTTLQAGEIDRFSFSNPVE